MLLFFLEFRDDQKVVELGDYLGPQVDVAVLADLAHIVDGRTCVWLVLRSHVVHSARRLERVVLEVRLSVGCVAFGVLGIFGFVSVGREPGGLVVCVWVQQAHWLPVRVQRLLPLFIIFLNLIMAFLNEGLKVFRRYATARASEDLIELH